MGQRSQIYVKYDGKLIIANYYQWNYAERMVSRARHGIEYMLYYIDKGNKSIFNGGRETEKIRRYFDVNFDLKDIVMSVNIFDEYKELAYEDESLYDYAFYRQGNNDGKLLIDITTNTQGKKIKYAFLDDDCDPESIMDVMQYMEWDMPMYKKYMDADQLSTLKKNDEAIHNMAQLMTKSEVELYLCEPCGF